MNDEDKKYEDIQRETSDLPGLQGLFESLLRRFRVAAFVAMLVPVAVLCIFCLGTALIPGLYLNFLLWDWCSKCSLLVKAIIMGQGIAAGYILYGVSICFIAPAVNFLLPIKINRWRGIWHSIQAIPWYIHNALTYIVRYTFLDLATPTPLNVLFYKMMGMKIGKGVVINTTNISDPCLITIGDYVTIGGSATIFAHYGQKGYLIIAPVEIKKGVTIGLHASVMGGVTVGENVNVLPHTVVLPRTVIPDNSVYGRMSYNEK